MAKILLVLSLLLLLGSAALSYLNKGKQDDAVIEKDQLNQQMLTQKKEVEDAKAAVVAAEEALQAEVAKREAAMADLDELKKEVRDVNSKVTGLEQQIAEKEEELIAMKAAATEDAGSGDTAATSAEVEEAKATIAELEEALAAAEEEKKVLTAAVEQERQASETLREAESRRVSQQMARGLSGKVLAHNPAWNFVVLSIGDRQGVTNNAEMIVNRGGQAIGKVKITSVEPSTSIADVLPSSLASGVQIQPGDTVIYQ